MPCNALRLCRGLGGAAAAGARYVRPALQPEPPGGGPATQVGVQLGGAIVAADCGVVRAERWRRHSEASHITPEHASRLAAKVGRGGLGVKAPHATSRITLVDQ